MPKSTRVDLGLVLDTLGQRERSLLNKVGCETSLLVAAYQKAEDHLVLEQPDSKFDLYFQDGHCTSVSKR